VSSIKGRLADRKKASIELNGREIIIKSGGGFFGGNPSNRVIHLDELETVEHRVGEKPFPDALMVKLVTPDEEWCFFSVNQEPLERLAVEAKNYVEKRSRLLDEMEHEYEEERAAHLALLVLNLELVDALSSLVMLLHGSINWLDVEEAFSHVEHVNHDRVNLTVIDAVHLSLERLSAGVEKRSIKVIKREVYDILFTLNESCREKAKYRENWFNTQFHHLFFEVLLLLWCGRLGGITGESVDDLEKSWILVEDLQREVKKDIDEIPLIEDDLGFNDSRLILYAWAEALGVVDFTPGDELEKRLAA
jgi:hypothetical protein